MTFVLLAFATYLVCTTLTSLLPFHVPARLQPFVVVGVAYGLYHLPSMWLLLVAAGGAVAVLYGLAGTALDPWDWAKVRNLIPVNLAKKPKASESRRVRIPTL